MKLPTERTGLRRLAAFAALALLAVPPLAPSAVAQQPAAQPPAGRGGAAQPPAGRGGRGGAAQPAAPGRGGAAPAAQPPPVLGPPRSFRPTATVPSPRVTGPIAVRGQVGDRNRDYPWMSSQHNLALAGYVEEEFFFEGTAREFSTGANAAPTGTTPFKSRILIRRPRDMRRFNGTVLAEWQNVTAGFDLDAMWNGAYEHIIRAGYVWAGISAQRVGLEGNATDRNGLKQWSPTRYGTLNIPNDNFSYDIFAQGMQALDNPGPVNLLGGARPRTIIAMGASQSAGRLTTYVNALHPQLGGPVDAYLLMIGGSLTRDDINVPVFRLYSETEVRAAPNGMKADSDIYRHWEVAGSSHSTRRSSMNSGPTIRRDGAMRPPPSCTYPTFPRVPMNNVLAAVYDHLSTWARGGAAPPRAPLVERNAQGPIRDARGNVQAGGIRLAEFDPATARNSSDNGGTQFCNLYGRYEPFDDATLRQLYPTHAAYVQAANARTDANLRAGYIVEADARISRLRAEQSVVGYGWPCAAACRAGNDLIDSAWYYLGIAPGRDALLTRLSTIVRNIAQGDAAGGAAEAAANAKARRDLERWVADLSAMAGRGQISPTILGELGTGANAILRALPAG